MWYHRQTEVKNMFTYVRLKNFLSFGDVTFDFKKNANTAKNFIAVYGENGSGKSNFVKSFDLLLHTIASFSHASQVEKLKKALKDDQDAPPADILEKIFSNADISSYISSCRTIDCEDATEIEYGFLLNGYEGVYRLSFSETFTNESLYYLAGKQRGYLYNITKDSAGNIKQKFWSGLFLNDKAREEAQEEISKYWGKHTFLGIVMHQVQERNYKYIENSISQNLLNVVNMMWDNTTVISQQSNHHNTIFASDKPNNILEDLKSGKITKDKLPQLESSERVLREFFTQTYADIKDVSYEKEFVEDKIKYQLYVDKMISGKIRHINFENESAGTQQILDIVKMLLGLFCGITVVYDEIDNGIHDLLLNTIINSLVDEISGQLIITTHNTMLLEVIDIKSAYVIRTDYLGNKEVKCFDEFSLQNTNNARIKYLKGLFGGTPFIDGIDYDAIIEEIEDSKGDR